VIIELRLSRDQRRINSCPPAGFWRATGREGTRVVRRYPLDPGALADLASRYNPAVGFADEPGTPTLSPEKRQQPEQRHDFAQLH
jgi:hypothetical protein